MTLGVSLNNPGNLTVNGPNSFLYSGQSGVHSANGLYYAVFPDAQTGASALTSYITRNAGNYSSLSSFGNTYSGGDSNWINNVANYLGVSPSASPSSLNVNQFAAAITNAEGNNGVGNVFGGGSTSNGLSAAFDPNNNTVYTGPISQSSIDKLIGVGESVTGSQSNTTDALTGLTSLSNTISNAVKTSASLFQLNTWERAAFIILGIGLVVIAVTVLIVENKTVQQAATKVAQGAAIAA